MNSDKLEISFRLPPHLTRAFLHALGFELPAGGEDIPAAGCADGRGVTGAVDDVGKGFNALPSLSIHKARRAKGSTG